MLQPVCMEMIDWMEVGVMEMPLMQAKAKDLMQLRKKHLPRFLHPLFLKHVPTGWAMRPATRHIIGFASRLRPQTLRVFVSSLAGWEFQSS